MIHTATLIHDDVLDEATLRRHLDTVNARWDNEASVLLGDYLFTRAICLASVAGRPVRLPGDRRGGPDDVRGRAAADREPRQLRPDAKRTTWTSSPTRRPRLTPAAAGWARTTPAPTRTGARDARPASGSNLGIAFQIADDLLDVLGDEATAGKSLGTDLVKQKATLPLIRLLSQADRSERAELLAILSSPSEETPPGAEALVGAFRRDLLRPRKGHLVRPARRGTVAPPGRHPCRRNPPPLGRVRGHAAAVANRR